MKTLLSTALVLTFCLAYMPPAHAQVSFGVTIGHPPLAPGAEYIGPQPGPDYQWVEGYWYPVEGRWEWHAGYWTRAPYAGAYWVAPYHDGRRWEPGYWDGARGRVDHDHRWDRDRGRDGDRRGGGRDRRR